MKLVLASVICLWAPALAAAPADESQHAWLEWANGSGAETCADAVAFAKKVEQQLRASPAQAAVHTQVSISIRVGRESALSGRWSAELQVRGANDRPLGGRTIRVGGDSCRQLEDALAFMTTLILSGASPETALVPPEAPSPFPPSSAGTGGPPATPSPVSVPPPRPQDQPAAVGQTAGASPLPARLVDAVTARALPPAPVESTGRFEVDAGVATGIGQLPRASLGITALASFRPKRGGARLLLSFGFWPEQRSSIDAEHGVTSRLVVAGLGGCPLERRWSSLIASACFMAEVAHMEASGQGFPVEQRQSRWLADLSAGGELRQHIAGGLFGALEARALVPVARARIGFVGADGQIQNVFTSWPVAAVAALRLGYRF